MTVVYETGISTSPADLLSKLETFAAANGWTVNTVTGGKVFVNGDIVCGVAVTSTALLMRGAVSYNGAAAWNAQTGVAAATSEIDTNLGTGPFANYYFFAGNEGAANYLQGIVEISAGVYRHFLLCELVKFGTYTGGQYFDNTFHNGTPSVINDPESLVHRYICDVNNFGARGHVRTTVDGRSNTFSELVNVGNQTVNDACGDIRGGMCTNLQAVGHARWNLRTVLEPMRVYVRRPSLLLSPMGRIPNMRFINMALFAAAEEFEVGGITWKAFPITARQSAAVGATTPSSGLYGYAYLMP